MKWILLCSIALYLFGGHKRALFSVALAAELAYLAGRGAALGRLPLVGPHDTLVFFSASLALMTVPFFRSSALCHSKGFSWGAGFLAALFALLALPFPSFAMPLPPVLKTFWFELHVALAFFAYALFAIGALLGALFLGNRERPLIDLQYRACLVGYSFFSASMVVGRDLGLLRLGDLLALDAEGVLDLHPLALLYPLPPCAAERLPVGRHRGLGRDRRVCGDDVYVPGGQYPDEKLAQLLRRLRQKSICGVTLRLPSLRRSAATPRFGKLSAPCIWSFLLCRFRIRHFAQGMISMVRNIYDRLASLNLGLWLTGGVIVLLAVGSFTGGGEGAGNINNMALFAWLVESPLALSWWLWAAVGFLALLALNTVLCSIESVRSKFRGARLLALVAPQAMHLGFLLIVLAHLFSAWGGGKEMLPVREGEMIGFPDGGQVQIANLRLTTGPMGMPSDYSAEVRFPAGSGLAASTISPNHPGVLPGVRHLPERGGSRTLPGRPDRDPPGAGGGACAGRGAPFYSGECGATVSQAGKARIAMIQSCEKPARAGFSCAGGNRQAIMTPLNTSSAPGR